MLNCQRVYIYIYILTIHNGYQTNGNCHVSSAGEFDQKWRLCGSTGIRVLVLGSQYMVFHGAKYYEVSKPLAAGVIALVKPVAVHAQSATFQFCGSHPLFQSNPYGL